MVSGRVWVTRAILDKLESIPDRVNLSIDEYSTLVQEHNLVLAGQTDEMAPADKKMYANEM